MTTDHQKMKLEVLPDKNLFVFPEGMSQENLDAAKACHALATQSANKLYNAINDPRVWFAHYIFVMSKMGWSPTNVDVLKVTESNQRLEISNLLGKGLQTAYGAFTGDLATALEGLGKTVVSALAASANNVELLGRTTSENDRTEVSLNRCEYSSEGNMAMAVSAIQTDAKPDKTANYLLAKWDSSGTTNFACGAVLEFDARQYEKLRSAVEGKLDASALEVLLALDI
ncbi:hypothetical protein DMX11_19570 [Pseudomonas sp. LB-090624]|uniref:hypothetical protein n=1 Tax=Pseudomonas sp. LB-090624 TaxID=2213079 RepID=UPI000D8BB905|nr:hypothetical protein [Pseudomonas sp. LB-090624]PYB71630.1 hypothetical protein DMX11_19570 [Pseudomonas sp. LB-090624]